MKRISGILDAYGPSVGDLGGMRYSYITVRQDDGRVANLPGVVAYPDVQAAITRIIDRDEQDRRVTIHSKGNLLIYALEEQGGSVHSDVGLIRTMWLASFAWAFGPWLLAALLFWSGDRQLGIAGFLVSLFGFISAIKYSRGIFLFWPGFGAGALHRRSRSPLPGTGMRQATA
jgi:hypothetical protein